MASPSPSKGGTDDLASYVHLIETLEAGGHLDRQVEGLAKDQELLRRAADGQGLTRPELAVLLSTAKLALQAAIEHGMLASDPAFASDLIEAFPPGCAPPMATPSPAIVSKARSSPPSLPTAS